MGNNWHYTCYNKEVYKTEMKSSTIYAKRIYQAKSEKWNDITNDIYTFCRRKKVDPYMMLGIYYIEDYFRPKWIQLLELILYKLKILHNPSIGPFQVRISNLKKLNTSSSSVVLKSLMYMTNVAKQCGLMKNQRKRDFKMFGEKYNLDPTYGCVLMELHSMLKRLKWNKY